MADILLIFPPDKKPAALQLAEAVAAGGYGAALEEASDGDRIVALARSAPAALLVWSRALASSAVLDGWLAPLRQVPGLIEVSTDGIGPQGGDESRIILLSGWRGQPFHQGWQRIHKRLQDLAAPARPPARKPAVAAAGAGEGKAPAPGRRTRLGIGAAAALTVAAALGATTWVSTKGSNQEEATRAQAAAVATPQAAKAPLPVAEVPNPPAAAALPAPVEGAATTPEPKLASAPSPARETRPAPAAKKQTVTQAPPIKRYTKRGARKMAKFCANAGRNTPECRTFARSMAAR